MPQSSSVESTSDINPSEARGVSVAVAPSAGPTSTMVENGSENTESSKEGPLLGRWNRPSVDAVVPNHPHLSPLVLGSATAPPHLPPVAPSMMIQRSISTPSHARMPPLPLAQLSNEESDLRHAFLLLLDALQHLLLSSTERFLRLRSAVQSLREELNAVGNANSNNNNNSSSNGGGGGGRGDVVPRLAVVGSSDTEAGSVMRFLLHQGDPPALDRPRGSSSSIHRPPTPDVGVMRTAPLSPVYGIGSLRRSRVEVNTTPVPQTPETSVPIASFAAGEDQSASPCVPFLRFPVTPLPFVVPVAGSSTEAEYFSSMMESSPLDAFALPLSQLHATPTTSTLAGSDAALRPKAISPPGVMLTPSPPLSRGLSAQSFMTTPGRPPPPPLTSLNMRNARSDRLLPQSSSHQLQSLSSQYASGEKDEALSLLSAVLPEPPASPATAGIMSNHPGSRRRAPSHVAQSTSPPLPSATVVMADGTAGQGYTRFADGSGPQRSVLRSPSPGGRSFALPTLFNSRLSSHRGSQVDGAARASPGSTTPVSRRSQRWMRRSSMVSLVSLQTSILDLIAYATSSLPFVLQTKRLSESLPSRASFPAPGMPHPLPPPPMGSAAGEPRSEMWLMTQTDGSAIRYDNHSSFGTTNSSDSFQPVMPSVAVANCYLLCLPYPTEGDGAAYDIVARTEVFFAPFGATAEANYRSVVSLTTSSTQASPQSIDDIAVVDGDESEVVRSTADSPSSNAASPFVSSQTAEMELYPMQEWFVALRQALVSSTVFILTDERLDPVDLTDPVTEAAQAACRDQFIALMKATYGVVVQPAQVIFFSYKSAVLTREVLLSYYATRILPKEMGSNGTSGVPSCLPTQQAYPPVISTTEEEGWSSVSASPPSQTMLLNGTVAALGETNPQVVWSLNSTSRGVPVSSDLSTPLSRFEAISSDLEVPALTQAVRRYRDLVGDAAIDRAVAVHRQRHLKNKRLCLTARKSRSSMLATLKAVGENGGSTSPIGEESRVFLTYRHAKNVMWGRCGAAKLYDCVRGFERRVNNRAYSNAALSLMSWSAQLACLLPAIADDARGRLRRLRINLNKAGVKYDMILESIMQHYRMSPVVSLAAMEHTVQTAFGELMQRFLLDVRRILVDQKGPTEIEVRQTSGLQGAYRRLEKAVTHFRSFYLGDAETSFEVRYGHLQASLRRSAASRNSFADGSVNSAPNYHLGVKTADRESATAEYAALHAQQTAMERQLVSQLSQLNTELINFLLAVCVAHVSVLSQSVHTELLRVREQYAAVYFRFFSAVKSRKETAVFMSNAYPRLDRWVADLNGLLFMTTSREYLEQLVMQLRATLCEDQVRGLAFVRRVVEAAKRDPQKVMAGSILNGSDCSGNGDSKIPAQKEVELPVSSPSTTATSTTPVGAATVTATNTAESWILEVSAQDIFRCSPQSLVSGDEHATRTQDAPYEIAHRTERLLRYYLRSFLKLPIAASAGAMSYATSSCGSSASGMNFSNTGTTVTLDGMDTPLEEMRGGDAPSSGLSWPTQRFYVSTTNMSVLTSPHWPKSWLANALRLNTDGSVASAASRTMEPEAAATPPLPNEGMSRDTSSGESKAAGDGAAIASAPVSPAHSLLPVGKANRRPRSVVQWEKRETKRLTVVGAGSPQIGPSPLIDLNHTTAEEPAFPLLHLQSPLDGSDELWAAVLQKWRLQTSVDSKAAPFTEQPVLSLLLDVWEETLLRLPYAALLRIHSLRYATALNELSEPILSSQKTSLNRTRNTMSSIEAQIAVVQGELDLLNGRNDDENGADNYLAKLSRIFHDAADLSKKCQEEKPGVATAL